MRVRLRQIILTRILWIERTEVVFMEKPLVSVMMPVYNGKDILEKRSNQHWDRRFQQNFLSLMTALQTKQNLP